MKQVTRTAKNILNYKKRTQKYSGSMYREKFVWEAAVIMLHIVGAHLEQRL